MPKSIARTRTDVSNRLRATAAQTQTWPRPARPCSSYTLKGSSRSTEQLTVDSRQLTVNPTKKGGLTAAAASFQNVVSLLPISCFPLLTPVRHFRASARIRKLAAAIRAESLDSMPVGRRYRRNKRVRGRAQGHPQRRTLCPYEMRIAPTLTSEFGLSVSGRFRGRGTAHAGRAGKKLRRVFSLRRDRLPPA